MGPVDSHCHLQDRAFHHDRAAVLERAWRAGLSHIVLVGWDLPSSQRAVEMASRDPRLHAVIGIHPHEARRLSDAGLAGLRELARAGRACALGEIGLDFYRNLSPRDDQERSFAAQLSLAAEVGLPVVIHSRNADDQCYETLERWAHEQPAPAGGVRGVLHCYTGPAALAARYWELGFMISVPGPVTYPKNEEMRRLGAELPDDALVVETDAPSLPPQSRRGRRNEPAFLLETLRALAELRRTTVERLAELTGRNALRLFRLSETPGGAPR